MSESRPTSPGPDSNGSTPPADLADRLDVAERSLVQLRKLLMVGEGLIENAASREWQLAAAELVLEAIHGDWAVLAVVDREVDRLVHVRANDSSADLVIRPAGFLRNCSGARWESETISTARDHPLSLGEGECWFVPLQGQQRTLGVLIAPKVSVDDDEVSKDHLTLLGRQLGTAAELARLHAEVLDSATYDRLTRAWMRSAWIEAVQERLDRGAEEGGTAALLILDLDHFKAINDTLGHGAGDEYLVDCAQAMNSALRSDDLLGRYGGDEFVLWLEGYPVDRLDRVAERLLVQVNKVAGKLQSQLGEGAPTLGVTMGVTAVHHGHGLEMLSLLDAADQALYAAKRAGRGTWRIALDPPMPAAPAVADRNPSASGAA